MAMAEYFIAVEKDPSFLEKRFIDNVKGNKQVLFPLYLAFLKCNFSMQLKSLLYFFPCYFRYACGKTSDFINLLKSILCTCEKKYLITETVNLFYIPY